MTRVGSIRGRSGSAALTLLVVLGAACASSAGPSPGPGPVTDRATRPGGPGPLTGISRTEFGQPHVPPGKPLFLGGNLGLFNDASDPVTVVSVTGWGEQSMRLDDATYILTDAGKGDPDGFDGATGATSLTQAAIGSRGWEHMAPLVGAVLPPCCAQQIDVGLQISPVANAATGTIRGITITYRTTDGREWVTNAPAPLVFCVGADEDPACKAANDAMVALHEADNAAGASFDDLNKPGSWHG